MAFLPALSSVDIQQYHRVVTRSAEVRSHFDLLIWLQGDLQRYLPHHIMVAAWGKFEEGSIQYDVLSPLPGVRSHTANPETLLPFLTQLFSRWSDFGKKPFILKVGEGGFELNQSPQHCALTEALRKMRSAMVHGINDARGQHDCLYITFGTQDQYGEGGIAALSLVLPHIDVALRQVAQLPQLSAATPTRAEQSTTLRPDTALSASQAQDWGLSSREAEIVAWVAMGKTNPDIGMILGISAFTVKNHLQRIFRKLDVSNRAQAVGKLNPQFANV